MKCNDLENQENVQTINQFKTVRTEENKSEKRISTLVTDTVMISRKKFP